MVKTIGLLMVADDDDILERTLAYNADAPYDWVFVDGDHGEWGVSIDVATCVPLVREGGLLLLHDIDGGTHYDGDYPPRQQFRSLAETHETWEWVSPEPMPWAHGIGVVQL